MNINTLTIKAQEALHEAFAIAQRNGQQAVEPLHILSSIIEKDDSLAAFLLGRAGANVRIMREQTRSAIASLPQVSGGDGQQYFSQDSSRIIQRAVDFTKNFNDKYASIEHILLALVAEKSSAQDMLKPQGASTRDL